MKTKTCSLLLVVFFALPAATEANKTWEEWKTAYDKVYDTAVEDAHRMRIWLETTKEVTTHNEEYTKGLHTYTQKVGKFADLTTEEFTATYFSSRQMISTVVPVLEPELDQPNVPQSIDWRNNSGNFVTPVKDQGYECGSCWAFAATGGLESRCAIKHGVSSLTSLSEQQLVSCDIEGQYACNGGYEYKAWQWLNANGGSATEADYPYVSGENGYVPPCETSHVGHSMPGNLRWVPKSEAALEIAVAQGPVSVGIKDTADFKAWKNYNSGTIFYDAHCAIRRISHSVLVVGYGSNDQGDYWIVKNSWGSDWGNDGYIWMSRNRHINCGIALEASYPECA